MAQRTTAEKIAVLEARRDALEASILDAHLYVKLESSGQHGARTSFTDPEKLSRMLKTVENKLSTLYAMKSEGL